MNIVYGPAGLLSHDWSLVHGPAGLLSHDWFLVRSPAGLLSHDWFLVHGHAGLLSHDWFLVHGPADVYDGNGGSMETAEARATESGSSRIDQEQHRPGSKHGRFKRTRPDDCAT